MNNSKTYDSFFFRSAWWQSMKNLPNQCRAEVYDALCKYVFEGVEPVFDPMSATSMAIRFIMTDIDRDKAKYAEVSERRAAAGRRGAMVTNQKKANSANAENDVNTDDQHEDEFGKSRQNAANSAFAAKEKKGNDMYIKEEINENEKDKSFSFSQKKEKIIFDFSLILLSEGRPNAYKEARAAYDFNESTGWTTETTKPNGDVTKKKITNPLAWLQGWKRTNEQIFAPADGILFANVLRELFEKHGEGLNVHFFGDWVINYFRGFRHEGENVSILFTNVNTAKNLQSFVEGNKDFQSILYPALQKQFAGAQTLYYKTI